MNPLTLHPIGIIHTPHTDPDKTPIQPHFAAGIPGTIEIAPAFEQGLQDLEGFSHLWLIYAFHRAAEPRLTVTPFLEDVPHGVFATRAPCRPNPIGISLVRLTRREGRILHIEDIDILDATPLIDIKPYIPSFDRRDHARAGWLDRIDDQTAQMRGRRNHTGQEADDPAS